MAFNSSSGIPAGVDRLLARLVNALRGVLGNNLVGVYLHGSLAMGTFNPTSSDIDLLAVVEAPLSADFLRNEIVDVLLDSRASTRSKGPDIEFVTRQTLVSFQHPAQAELHLSPVNAQMFAEGRADLGGTATDSELAAHLVTTRVRGICLYGEPIETVIPSIPKQDYLRSIDEDAQWIVNNIRTKTRDGACAVPVYGVLNLCRSLAFIGAGLIGSKREGGQWAFRHLPTEFRPLVEEALKEYGRAGAGAPVEGVLLKRFAAFASHNIEKASPAEPDRL